MKYRIYGIAPEVPEGHEFESDVEDLEDWPTLWRQECPYNIHNLSIVLVRKED